MNYLKAIATLCTAAILLGQSANAVAQEALLDEVRTVGAADAAVPVEHEFEITVAGNYEVVLTDLGAPGAPLASVRLAVTRGNEIVGTPLTAVGVLPISAAAGRYVVRVTGNAAAAVGSGLFRVVVRHAAGGPSVDNFVGVLAKASGTPSAGQFLFETSIVVSTSGSYDLSLSDFQWPQAIDTLLLALVEEGGPLLAALGTDPPAATQQTLNLDSTRQYRLFAVAVTNAPTTGGLYRFTLQASGGGLLVARRLIAVGGAAPLGSITLAAGSHVLSVTDLAFPTPLAQRAALVVHNGELVASTLTVGDAGFTALAGPHDVYAHAASAAGAGSLQVGISPQNQPAVFDGAIAVAAPSSGITAYTYEAGVSATNYTVRLADYQFTSAFQSLRLGVSQGAALLGTTLAAAGTTSITPSAGKIHLLAFAQPAAQGGLFGVDVAPVAAGAVAFETTQGVGRTFAARKISVLSPGRYDVAVTDVAFPARFDNLAVAVTRGADRVGLIYGDGTFSFPAILGNYFLNFIAQPDADEDAGTYSMRVVESPPAPAVTLTATPGRVASGGGAVDLTWSTQRAASCAASSGWTGAKSTAGTERTTTISATTTFTLTCTGAGGDTAQSVTVEVSAPSSGGGGGGALGVPALLALAAFALGRALRGSDERRA